MSPRHTPVAMPPPLRWPLSSLRTPARRKVPSRVRIGMSASRFGRVSGSSPEGPLVLTGPSLVLAMDGATPTSAMTANDAHEAHNESHHEANLGHSPALHSRGKGPQPHTPSPSVYADYPTDPPTTAPRDFAFELPWATPRAPGSASTSNQNANTLLSPHAAAAAWLASLMRSPLRQRPVASPSGSVDTPTPARAKTPAEQKASASSALARAKRYLGSRGPETPRLRVRMSRSSGPLHSGPGEYEPAPAVAPLSTRTCSPGAVSHTVEAAAVAVFEPMDGHGDEQLEAPDELNYMLYRACDDEEETAQHKPSWV